MGEGRYLFDTGALVDAYHGRARIKPYFDRLFDRSLLGYISPITEAELWRGLRPDELERHEALLVFFIPLPLASASARLAGEWMRRYGEKGLGWMDALIAATAARAGASLLTRDRRLAAVLQAELEFTVYDLPLP
jgi:predicted nucleic acid-binding protein